ncbi:MAG TPA: hypothetical protein VIQ30_24260 [Pseudonocardia sp.]
MAGGSPAGGSLQLVQLIDEHGQALVADFEHHYRRDLRDLWREGRDLTPRYALWLVGQLPEGSAFFASLQGGPRYRAWTLQNHLAAATVNLLYAANHQRANKKMKKPPIVAPKPTIAARARRGRVMRIANLPSARKVAGG